MTRGLGMQTLVTAILLCSGLPAMADGFGFSFGYAGRHHHHYVDVVVGRPAPVIVTPAPVVVAQPVWVPPVYRTVTERAWVPTTRTTFRDVPVYDRWGRVAAYRREVVRVPSGYWSQVTRQVLVRDGYWAPPVAPGLVASPTGDPNIRPGEDADNDEVSPRNENGDSDPQYRGTDTGRSVGPGGTRASLIR